MQLVSHLFVHAHEKYCFILACKHLVQLQSGIEATPTRQMDMQSPGSGSPESTKEARSFIRYACNSFTDPNRPKSITKKLYPLMVVVAIMF